MCFKWNQVLPHHLLSLLWFAWELFLWYIPQASLPLIWVGNDSNPKFRLLIWNKKFLCGYIYSCLGIFCWYLHGTRRFHDIYHSSTSWILYADPLGCIQPYNSQEHLGFEDRLEFWKLGLIYDFSVYEECCNKKFFASHLILGCFKLLGFHMAIREENVGY